MTGNNDLIKNNIEAVHKRISASAAKVGRDPEDIKLIGVSKTVDAARIREAYKCGIEIFGENRVQELCEKTDILDVECIWHMIGHLQTNKVKYIIDKVDLIHSLDSLELAREINKRAEKAGRIANVLVQVNVAREDTKFGIGPEDTIRFVKEVSQMGNIGIKGLMTIAPFSQNPEGVRWVFAGLGKLRIDISKENIDNVSMDYLSMGMSNDFEVAIEEGSNMVRIGTALFGSR
jgi:pyridoxal phosphate enzyme (YggS family)